MTCREMEGLLVGLVTGDLAPVQEEFVRLHLRGCTGCQQVHARLLSTRQALQALKEDPYRPDLARRIAGAIQRERQYMHRSTWLSRLLQGVTAAAVLVLMLLAVLRAGPGPQPAAGEPPSPVYLVEGRALLGYGWDGHPVEQTTLRGSGSLHPDAGVVDSAFDLWVLSPDGGQIEGGLKVARIDAPMGRSGNSFFGLIQSGLVTRHGSVAWIVHPPTGEPQTGQHGVGRLDLETGQFDPDPLPKEGTAYRAALAADGHTAYVLISLGGSLRVSVIGTESRQVTATLSLPPDLTTAATLLPSHDGTFLHVVDRERLITFNLTTGHMTYDLTDADLLQVATLDPTGHQVLAARPTGGLHLLDPQTGRSLKLTGGPRYIQVEWRHRWIYGVRAGAIDLIDPLRLKVIRSLELPITSTVWIP